MPGQCTLNPAWVQTPPYHYCGQFVESFGNPQVPARANKEIDYRGEINDRANAQQARAINAEKALKVARRELKALKAK